MNLSVLGQFGDLNLGVEFFCEIDEILAFLGSKLLEFHQFHGKIDAVINFDLAHEIKIHGLC